MEQLEQTVALFRNWLTVAEGFVKNKILQFPQMVHHLQLDQISDFNSKFSNINWQQRYDDFNYEKVVQVQLFDEKRNLFVGKTAVVRK